MKKIMFFVLLLTVTISAFGQSDVTKFLGIPVDGFKSEMIQKLKEKGFVNSTLHEDILEGEFNGRDVYISAVTNNNKVYRIFLKDKVNVDEGQIKTLFNTLCKQFKENSKYISLGNYEISEDEDISYEMSVNNKRYEAIFYQKPILTDSIETVKRVKESLDKALQKHSVSEEELENATEDVEKEILKSTILYAMEWASKKAVWFSISESYGEYYISMYYDNEYNKANGEDL